MELLIIIAFLYSLYRLIGYWERKAAKERSRASQYPSATIRRINQVELDEAETKISE